jgi:uncharacterized LabA/DUF88 family protein
VAEVIRATAFFDGQNLYRSAQLAFGISHPNFDPRKLAKLVAIQNNLELTAVRFYTGVPHKRDDSFWSHFWEKKLLQMSRYDRINVFTRELRFNEEEIVCPEGHSFVEKVGREKGIDVRIALDVLRLAIDKSYDAAIIFSQDQDLSEAIKEVKAVGKAQNRMIHLFSAFPHADTYLNKHGVHGTKFCPITKHEYDACIDKRDYRPPLKKF